MLLPNSKGIQKTNPGLFGADKLQCEVCLQSDTVGVQNRRFLTLSLQTCWTKLSGSLRWEDILCLLSPAFEWQTIMQLLVSVWLLFHWTDPWSFIYNCINWNQTRSKWPLWSVCLSCTYIWSIPSGCKTNKCWRGFVSRSRSLCWPERVSWWREKKSAWDVSRFKVDSQSEPSSAVSLSAFVCSSKKLFWTKKSFRVVDDTTTETIFCWNTAGKLKDSDEICWGMNCLLNC